jgi:hypothetical protein
MSMLPAGIVQACNASVLQQDFGKREAHGSIIKKQRTCSCSDTASRFEVLVGLNQAVTELFCLLDRIGPVLL